MQHTEQVEIPAKKATRVVRTECDICGRDIPGEGHCEVREVEVSLKEGHSFGADGGDTETLEFDICAECFREKLVPWIASHRGAKPRVAKCSW